MDKVKEVKLNRKERGLIKVAEQNGFKQWGYKTWRFKRTRKGKLEEYILTKSIANKGEWSFVQKFLLGETQIKTTTKEIDYLIYAIHKTNENNTDGVKII